MELLDINELVEETTEFVASIFPSNIAVKIECDDETPPVRAAQSQIEQILMNLYTNARDAMPEGGTLSVETSAWRVDSEMDTDKEEGRYAVIRVSDTGVGLDDTTAEEIFKPFFTTKEEGTGMGLSIIHGLVRDDNGYIDVESEPGEGTTFTVYLPAAEET